MNMLCDDFIIQNDIDTKRGTKQGFPDKIDEKDIYKTSN